MIYFDNSATTKPNEDVVKSFQDVTLTYFANPSSIHQLGATTERLLSTAKKQIAEQLQVSPEEVIMTSGGTEGNNTAIKGIALEHQKRGKHIITTEIEHPSVLETLKGLEKLGFHVTYLPVNENGVISINDLKEAIREDTILISIMHVNNEIGSIQPIEQAADIAIKHPKLFFHVDAVQSIGKVTLDLTHPGIDLCTFSGHKIHALKGSGVLYCSKRTKLFPLLHGGNQEQGVRSGTENLAGTVAFAKALRLLKENERTKLSSLQEIHDYLMDALENIPGVILNSSHDSAVHIINFSIPGVKPEVMIHMLGEKEIFISTKSACSSKMEDESKVLAACGFKENVTTSGLRVSLSYDNTMGEAKTFIHELQASIQQFKKSVG